MTVKYPQAVAYDFGRDGNAFALLASVQRALRQAGLASECQAFYEEATSGDYNHLIRTCMEWVTINYYSVRDDGDIEWDEDEDEDDYDDDNDDEYLP